MSPQRLELRYADALSMPKIHLATLVIAAALAAGCKHPGSRKLSGHWRGQKVEGVAENAQASADDFARRTDIIARDNQIEIVTPTSHPPAATYTVDKDDGTTLVIHTDRDKTSETFAFDDKTATMVWKIDARRSLTFKKLK
jgi:hypothetical protein